MRILLKKEKKKKRKIQKTHDMRNVYTLSFTHTHSHSQTHTYTIHQDRLIQNYRRKISFRVKSHFALGI